MPIPFTCPHCGAETTVADEYAGQSGPCNKCGKTITIPVPVGYGTAPPPRKTSVGVILAIVAGAGIMVLFCGGALVAFLLPATETAREAARRAVCLSNMKQLGLAMHNYHEVNGCFPPAYLPDENGNPMHSWRVLLLPYLEQKPLYDMYDFDEPWDGPSNIALNDLIQNVYRCPSENTGVAQTSYVMVVGPGTLSDGPTATKISDITDGTSFTIMLVEVANSGISWMEPRDLPAAELGLGVMPGGIAGVRSNHPSVANVLFCDGHTESLDQSVSPQILIDMSTIAGDEQFDFY